MKKIIQIGNCTITEAEIIGLIAKYQMLPLLWRELIIDQAIAPIELSDLDKVKALKEFDEKHQLTNLAERSFWGARSGMTIEQVETLATREIKIELFKTATWGAKLESYFLIHKSKLDKVVYSLLRTQRQEVATELYFRIEAGEQTFSELAHQYSAGPEAQTGGLLGPVELSKPHPKLAKMLSISKPRQLWAPIQLGEWFVILRLEKFIPAVLNDIMRQQLLNSLFEGWIQEQVIGLRVKGEREKEDSEPLPLNPYPLTSLNQKSSHSTTLEAV